MSMAAVKQPGDFGRCVPRRGDERKRMGDGGVGCGGGRGNDLVGDSGERGMLGVESVVDQRVVVAVDDAVVVEVAILPAGGLAVEAGVDVDVVGGVDNAGEIGVANVGVFDQRVGGGDGNAVEAGFAGRIQFHSQCGQRRIGGGGGTGNAGGAVPAGAVPEVAALLEEVEEGR